MALLDSLPAQLSRRGGLPPGRLLLSCERRSSAASTVSRKARRSLTKERCRLFERCLSIDQVSRASYRSRGNPLTSTLPDGDSQAYLLLSIAYLRLGDPDEAYEAVGKARALDPLNPQMYRQLSAVLAPSGPQR